MAFPFLDADFRALSDEIDTLEVRYRELLQEIDGSMRIQGGEHGTPDSDPAREQAQLIESELLKLRDILGQAVIVQPPDTSEVVAIGSRVTLRGPVGRDEVELGSYYLADEMSDTDRLSCNSPLGKQLLGCKVGDRVTGIGPNNHSFTVLAISVASVETKQLVGSAS